MEGIKLLCFYLLGTLDTHIH